MNDFAPIYRSHIQTGGLNYRSERSEFVDWIVPQLCLQGDIAGLHFLDVGCGTGELLELLYEAGARKLVGLDLSEGMLAEAARHVPAATRVQAAVEQHPFSPDRFDVVVAALAVHHLADMRSFFAMAREILRPGGRFFVLDYNPTAWAYSGWTYQAVRVLTSPARFLVRRKNRERNARRPQRPPDFGPDHRLRTAREFEAAANDCDLDPSFTSGGMLSAWFNQDLCPESELDRRLLRALRAGDRRLVPQGVGAFLWIHGVNESGRPAR